MATNYPNLHRNFALMILNIALLLVGIALVLWGADRFTDGSCAIARRWGVSELIIGLTVVAMGTSLPEFVVSLFSAIGGNADMSVGNIVGSNIFNSLVIVGASCLVLPIAVERSTLMRQLPICVFATAILVACGLTGAVSRWEALGMCALFGLFIWFSIRMGMNQRKEAANASNDSEETTNAQPSESGIRITLCIVAGIAALVGGGQMLVNSAAEIARAYGISESIIGLTILAGGTSLPELATSVVAARKGASGLSLGNAIGSNIFNICFVLGTCGAISPMQVNGMTNADWITLSGSIVLLWFFCFTGRRLHRAEGFVLLLGYAAYLTIRLMEA